MLICNLQLLVEGAGSNERKIVVELMTSEEGGWYYFLTMPFLPLLLYIIALHLYF